ncbi:MAG: SCO family protein [Verrucomicrobiales bacterium]|nr:SCO family protein [Verrucomicrobiales bacterium]
MNSSLEEQKPEDAQLAREQRFFTVIACGLAALGVVAVLAISRWRRSDSESPAAASTRLHTAGHDTNLRARWLADFELVERSGRKVSRTDLGNQYLVMNFVFTSCSLGCQEVNRRMSEIQTKVGTNDQIRLVSISIDPRTDTPEAMARFAQRFQADTHRWLFLTGSKTAICDLLEQSFFPDLSGENLLIPNGLRLTQEILLIDPDGKVRATFNGLDSRVTDVVMSEIERIRQPRAAL